MNPRENNEPVLTLMSRQAAEVGRIAAAVDDGGAASASGRFAFNVHAGRWLESLGYVERVENEDTPRWRSGGADALSPGVLRMLGERIEALVEITLEGSPVRLVTAFEQRWRPGERFIFSGRGPTPAAALKGCLFEAIETFAALWSAVAEAEHGDGGGAQAESSAAAPIDRVTQTVEAIDAVSGGPRRLPFHKVFLDLPEAMCPKGCRPCGSNGLAAGEDFEAAAVTALLELVERDAVAVWWRSRYRAPSFQARTRAGRAAIEAVALWLRSKDRKLHLLDLTHDIGMPVVLAVSTDGKGARPLIGASADCLADDAAYGAVSELLQMEANLALIAQNVVRQGVDVLPEKTRRLWDWHDTASLETHPFLLPSTEARDWRRQIGQAAAPSLTAIGKALQAVGADAAVVKLVDHASGVPVARAVSDALMDFDTTNERAASVPEQLGLIATRGASQAVNSEPVPL
jgi:thiazole/oxazole-forming peptide maturase SagD family component